MGVGDDTPASRAGMRGTLRTQGGVVLGDIIVSVAGLPTRAVEELLSAVEQQRVGDVVAVEVLRGVGGGGGGRVESATLRVQLVERQQVASGGGGSSRSRGGDGSIDVSRRRQRSRR
jgi:S1-C subfamily serine protease